MTREQLVESRAEAIEAKAIERHLSRLAAIDAVQAKLNNLASGESAAVASSLKERSLINASTPPVSGTAGV